MPSLIDIRRRVRAVKSTQQITKAMKMVSASKLRRAQDRVMHARPYANQALRVMSSVARRVDPSLHPLLRQSDVPGAPALLMVIAADRGLCGGFNSNIMKQATAFVQNTRDRVVALGLIGRKARDFFVRQSGAQAETIQGAKTFRCGEGACPTDTDRCPLAEVARLPQDFTKQYGRIDVGGQRCDCRSSARRSRMSTLSFRGGGSFTRWIGGVPGLGARIESSRRSPPPYGTMRAIGVFRSRTVSVRPRRTARRCSLSRALRSQIRTSSMTRSCGEWSRRRHVRTPLHLRP